MAKTIGIDFGNTQSIVSYIDDDTRQPQPLILENMKDTLQTVIGRINGQQNYYVGNKAIEQAGNSLNFSLHRYFKNDIGKKGGLKYYHKIDEGEIELNAQKFTLLYFQYLFKVVDNLLQLKYKVLIKDCNVVVTKPVDFDETQINHLQLALQQATGIDKKILFIDEPVAAAWHYQNEMKEESFTDGFYFFYDFGGGTFDCCIMKLDDDGFYPFILKSDKQLGGRNVDCEIAALILSKFGLSVSNKNDLDKDNKYNYILKKAEQIKIFFSENKTTSQPYLENINFNRTDKTLEFSREEFLECIRSYIERTIIISENCYNDACEKYNKRKVSSNFSRPKFKIERAILVGGSSLLPGIKEKLSKVLNIDEKNVDKFDPFHSISKGAAIYGSTVNMSDEKRGYMADSNFGFGFLIYDPLAAREKVNVVLKPQGNIMESRSATYFLPESVQDAFLELVQFKDEQETDAYNSILQHPLLLDEGWWQNPSREIKVDLTYNAKGELSMQLNDGKKKEVRNNITRELNEPELKIELQKILLVLHPVMV